MSAATYNLTADHITCHLCGRRSTNPNDMRERYCGHCHVFHEDPPIATALAVELAWKAHSPMEVVLKPMTVFQLTGVVQLALRHPKVPPDIRETAETFLTAVREYFADCPHVLSVVRRGDDPQEDL